MTVDPIVQDAINHPVLVYPLLYRIVQVELAILRHYPRGEMRCPVHLSFGQEFTAVGASMALRPQDTHAFIYSTHRCHAHYLANGGNLNRMIAELYGKATGCCGGMGGSMHLVDTDAGFMGAYPTVGSALSIAVGHAFAIRGSDDVVVAFCGDSVPETGQFWEAMNFASLHQLPLLVICENNGMATATPLRQRQVSGTWTNGLMARLPGIQYYCCSFPSNITAIYKTIYKARQGKLPAFVELSTNRLAPHVGMGDLSDSEILTPIRKGPEWQRWRRRCGQTEQVRIRIESTIEQKVKNAFIQAEAAPYPDSARRAYAVRAPQVSL